MILASYKWILLFAAPQSGPLGGRQAKYTDIGPPTANWGRVATVLADDWHAVVDAIEDRIQKFCLGLDWNRPVIRLVILVVFASIGALFLFISHREMKTEQLGAPIISSRTKHLIGLLLIFAGLAVFMSQFLIYSR